MNAAPLQGVLTPMIRSSAPRQTPAAALASPWRAALCALLLSACASPLAAAPLILHVSPAGRDSWSGLPAAPANADGPLATLPAALQKARAARKTLPAPDSVSILLRAGTYELDAPVVLTPDDSGASPQAPFLIAAYPGEHPVLSGGRRLAGWRPSPDAKGVWELALPAPLPGETLFRSLFLDGRRAVRARTPNEGQFFRMDGPRAQDKPCAFKFRDTDLRPEWAGAEIVALEKWTSWRFPLQSVPSNHWAVLGGDSTPHTREKDARYFVENLPAALDAPGEWYLDPAARLLKYIPLPGENPAQLETIAPRLTELVRFQGDLAARRTARHITLRGLAFRHTDWPSSPTGHRDSQAAPTIRGVVRGEAAVDCAIESCEFSRLGAYAVDFGKGCQGARITRCEMFDLGAGGVRLGEVTRPSTAFEESHSHRVEDNQIRHAGLVYFPAVGVFISHSGTNRVAHNDIHHLFYSAVSAGWQWGYQETPCRENIIEFNHLHHLGQGLLSDMGAVYTLGIQHGTVIRNNLIHDVESFTYGGWGLYTDEGSTGILLENNIVYRCKSAGFHQHYGRENIVRNNIFAFNRENQIMRTRAEAHTSFFFTNNIVLFDSGNLLGSNWSNDHYDMDRNLYFDARPGAILRFAGASLDQWQARGHDTHSLVADPQFTDAAKFDFTLRGTSPALKTGFHPIDLSTVGVRP